MTVQLNGQDIGAIVEGVVWAGSMLGLLVVCLIVYLMVRPPRHVRERRRAARRGELRTGLEPIEAEELRLVVDRMEARLEVLERALADQIERPAIGRIHEDKILTPAENGRVSGRTE